LRGQDKTGPSARGDAALGVCGGEARVFIEVLQLRSTLLIAGGGHVSQPLAELGHLLGFHTVVVDDRPEFAECTRFPHADELLAIPFDQLVQRVKVTPQTYAVIVTRGHQHDLLVLRQLVDTPAAYVGMIGSRKKVRTVFDHLLGEGVPAEKLARVHAPIGLRTGGQTPAEIALSILAEIVLVQHGGTGEPLSWRDNPLRARAPMHQNGESTA
jgi:xanthine dehydrogenase accessory factor